jgi:hypothetical protein
MRPRRLAVRGVLRLPVVTVRPVFRGAGRIFVLVGFVVLVSVVAFVARVRAAPRFVAVVAAPGEPAVVNPANHYSASFIHLINVTPLPRVQPAQHVKF